jgi:3-hydroxyacyl-[acyl-carrier-protein] dehydratase
MNNLKQDVAAALIDFATPREGEIESVFVFPAELPIFFGHFPGRPIVPGILELEMVRAAMERFTGYSLRLLSVEKAKFLREVKPGDRILLSISFSVSGVTFLVKGRSLVGEGKAALVDLKLTSGR